MKQSEVVIALEKSQLGYKEESGGWTKYGQWYADNVAHHQSFASADWCAMFQTWAMRHSGVSADLWPDTSPQGSEVNYLTKWLTDNGYRYGADIKPEPGDIVMYSWDGNPNDMDHVGLCVAVSGNSADDAVMDVVEGNYNDQVAIRKISYRDRRVAATFRLPWPDVEPEPKPVDFPALSFLLKKGSRGNAVEILQAGLISKGYDIVGGVDGYFGEYTRDALIAYQQAHKLIADGTAGTETFGSLIS